MTEPHAAAASRSLTPAEWSRIAGGVLFAVGALVLFFRKGSSLLGEEEWAAFPLLLVLLVPCALLLGLGTAGEPGQDRAAPAGERGRLEPWRTVYLVFGVLLVPLVLLQFVDLVGGSPGDSLNVAWVFLVTAVVALASSLRLGASYQALVAGLATIVAWLALWDKLLDDPESNTVRWLLIVIAILLLAGSVALRGAGRPQATELVTAAGVAGVVAGAFGAAEVAASLVGSLLSGGDELDGTGTGWDLLLVATSVALIAYGASMRVRGPGYVGAVGLLAFVLVVGAELGALAEGEDPERKLVGWPLLLMALGLAAVAASVLVRDRPGRDGAPRSDAP